MVGLNDPEVPDLLARQVRHALADVGAVEEARLGRLAVGARAGPGHAVGRLRRTRARPDRNGVPDVVCTLINKFAVAAHVHQVQAEPAALAPRRDQKILLRQRVRRLVACVPARGVVVGRLVRVLGRRAALGPRQVARHLRQAQRKVEALAGVDDADGPREPVVVPDAREHDAAGAGYLARLRQVIGPDGLVAPEDRGAGAVGLGGPEALDAPERLVGVLPPRVDDAAVVHQGGGPLGLIAATKNVEVTSVGVAPRQQGRVDERPAPHVTVAARRREEDAPVGQVNRVDVVVRPVGQPPGAPAVDARLVQVETLLVVGLVTEEDPPGVERQVGPPETARLPGREFPHRAAGVQPSQYQQPPARRRLDAHPVDRLVLPLRPLRVRLVDEE